MPSTKNEDLPTLAESRRFVVAHEFERAYVIEKASGRSVLLGDHHGDPKCGAISADERWFATGGEGLICFSFEHGTHEFLRDPWSAAASVWRVDLQRMSLEKLRDGPDLRDEPYREDIPF